MVFNVVKYLCLIWRGEIRKEKPHAPDRGRESAYMYLVPSQFLQCGEMKDPENEVGKPKANSIRI